MSTVDPKVNAQDRADRKRELEDKKTITKMAMEDRVVMSPYLRDPKRLKDQDVAQIDKIIASTKNNFPEEKAMKLKHLRDESYPAQKFTKSAKGDRVTNRIQVTPGKWVTK